MPKLKNLTGYIILSVFLFCIFFFIDKRSFLLSLSGAILIVLLVALVFTLLSSRKLGSFMNYIASHLRKKKIRDIYQYLEQQGIPVSLNLNCITVARPETPVTIQVLLSGIHIFLENVRENEAATWNNNELIAEAIPFRNGIALIAKSSISNEEILRVLQTKPSAT